MPNCGMLCFSVRSASTCVPDRLCLLNTSARRPELHTRSMLPFDPGTARYFLARGAKNLTAADSDGFAAPWAVASAHHCSGSTSGSTGGLPSQSDTAPSIDVCSASCWLSSAAGNRWSDRCSRRRMPGRSSTVLGLFGGASEPSARGADAP